MIALSLAVLAVLAVSFTCSVMEASFLSVTPSYILLLQQEGRRSGRLLAAQKAELERSIAAILALNTIANTAGASVVGAMALHIFGDRWIALFSGVFTVLVLVISEIIPKTIGATHWKRLMPVLAYPLAAMRVVLGPLVLLTSLVARLFSPRSRQQTVSRAELEIMAGIGKREGALREDEYRMVSRVIRLNRVSVREVMTPRTKIVAAPETATLAELEELILSSNHSRIPLYRESIDQIVGIVSERDVWKSLRDGATSLDGVVRPPKFVPSSKPIEELTREMREERSRIAVVADEYGGTAGLVTLADLIEEVVGEFRDEHENAQSDFQTVQDGWLVAGHLPLHMVAERLSIDLPVDDYDTVGGFVFGQLGRLPAVDDEVFWSRACFRVIGMDGRRIARLAIRITPESSVEEGGD